MTEIAIYTTPDGHVQLDVNINNDTLWLSQQQMAVIWNNTLKHYQVFKKYP